MKISDNPNVQSHYEQMIANGESHSLAEMLALRCPAGTGNTDRAFLEGRDRNQEFDTLAPDMREFYLDEAKKGGVNVRGKVYMSGLAEKPGDPTAWMSDRHEVEAKVKAKDWTITDK